MSFFVFFLIVFTIAFSTIMIFFAIKVTDNRAIDRHKELLKKLEELKK